MLGYFSKISQVCKELMKLTPKDYTIDLTFTPEITKEENDKNEQIAAVMSVTDENKQARNTGVRKLPLQQQTSSH